MAFISGPATAGTLSTIAVRVERTDIRAFLMKKVKKCLHVKKKYVPLQSQFEKARLRPEWDNGLIR